MEKKKSERGRPATGQGILFPARIRSELAAGIRELRQKRGGTLRAATEAVVESGLKRELMQS
jgi:hypothetical protein